MHFSFGPARISQTTGSLVAHLADPSHIGPSDKDHHDIFWTTLGSAPCTNIFRPFVGTLSFDVIQGLSIFLIFAITKMIKNEKKKKKKKKKKDVKGGQEFEPGSTWWKHEQLHRMILEDYTSLMTHLLPVQSTLERSFLQLIEESEPSHRWDARMEITKTCLLQAEDALVTVTKQIEQHLTHSRKRGSLILGLFRFPSFGTWLYERSWRSANLQARLPNNTRTESAVVISVPFEALVLAVAFPFFLALLSRRRTGS
jgi:hypothetical protein